ncbi:hypothetical protein M3221_11380 [Domibacillus indicus]|uniref:hypothetical protein n=1 Tax=Domibacillus indicus TaxID=1437523 RepID=UPI00203FC60D|nr:hypothetical protein [Domibacillus indicus]MCM3789009.1 hypothetical protein [Domibacillus indicus]
MGCYAERNDHKGSRSALFRRQFLLGSLYTAEEMGMEEFKSEQANLVPDYQKSPEGHTPESAQPVHSQEAEEGLPSSGEEPKSSSTEESQTASPEEADSKGFVLKHYDFGVSPSGIPCAKLYVVDQESKKEQLALAKGEESVGLTDLTSGKVHSFRCGMIARSNRACLQTCQRFDFFF